MKTYLLSALTMFTLSSSAQNDSITNPLTISGYLETYYTYDSSNPDNHSRPGFVYSHNRHNEVNLNLGFVKAAYSKDKVRANLALMAGTYANANLAAEPGVLKNLFEANVGVKISNKKNIWVDAGLFASHIGFESAIGKDCWNLTRSILADNSPYYESGVKISYTSDDERWYASGLFLNGWQHIQRPEGNNTPSFGHQIVFKPNSKISLNSSSFIGSDTPDSTRMMRYFHNFYAQWLFTDKVGMIVGFDIGTQQKAKNSDQYSAWYSPVVIVKYMPTQKTSVAARAEYYADKHGVIIATGTPNGFQTMGFSINFDYLIASNMMWRIEARTFSSRDKIFILNDELSTQNYFLTTAFAISF